MIALDDLISADARYRARYLQKRNVRSAERVAPCAKRSFETIVSLLGRLKSGAATRFVADTASLRVIIDCRGAPRYERS